MKFRELESLIHERLTGCGRSHLVKAYKTKNYLDKARHHNYKVTPDRKEALLASINQHIKELRRLEKELSSML